MRYLIINILGILAFNNLDAQIFQIDSHTINEAREYISLNPALTSSQLISFLEEEIIVLDSIVSYTTSLPEENGLSERREYYYNDEARFTNRKRYKYSTSFEEFFQIENYVWEYFQDSITLLRTARNSPLDTLHNSTFEIRTLDENNRVIESKTQLWNFASQQFIDNSFYTLGYDENYNVRTAYAWNTSQSAYTPWYKSENHVFEDSTHSIRYDVDENTGMFIYETRTTIATFENGDTRLFMNEDYTNGDWSISSLSNTYKNESDFTGYSLTLNNYETGILQLNDSIHYLLDEDLNIIERRYYSYNSDTDKFEDEFHRRFVSTYTPDGNVEQNRLYSSFASGDTLIGIGNFYYSTINVTNINQPLQNKLSIKLHYPNPACSNDFIRLTSTEQELNKPYLYQLYNQQGQLIQQQKIRMGDEVSLNSIRINGIYYIIISDGPKRHAWKILMQSK